MIASLLLTSLLLPQGEGSLQELLAAENHRVEVMARVMPAVCAVMRSDAPGGGSGVIIDPAGFILTNYHVVGSPAMEYMKIGMPDGQLHLAQVMGIDPGSDLAVLLLSPRQDGEAWPYARLGDSDRLLVGETVFAMGNPFMLATDFKPTVTWGVVSGTHRYQPGGGNRAGVYPDCIQVDAPVNPGNSGGPLFNRQGEVVGINGRISVRDRGRINVGVGFAIASKQILNFLPDLLAGRHAEHGTLDLNAWLMPASDEPSRQGVFVQSLFADSKVGDFGVELGDELTSFNSIELKSANQLATLVGILPAGSWVRIGFRPRQEDGSFAEERFFEMPLHTLDTGSSRDPNRIAEEALRRRSARMILREIPETTTAGSSRVSLLGPEGEHHSFLLESGQLRIVSSAGDLLAENGSTFKIDEDGNRSPASPEENARLGRVLTTVPWLWAGSNLRELCEDGHLIGGLMVYGRPAYRIELPGDGQKQVFLYRDGSIAGCQFRDPVLKALVEMRLGAGGSRVFFDGELRPDWRVEVADHADSVPEEPAERDAESLLEEVIDRHLPSVVKIHGASGLSTILPYASGVLVSTEGHILTLDQVMLQKGQTRVVLSDGSVHEAELLPPDMKLGLRLLKIDSAAVLGLEPLVPAESSPASGSMVVSIGNCFRLAEFSEKLSATFGVVVANARSGLRYRLQTVDYDGELVITDAPNNPGHFGGALITLEGKWVGINTRVVESTETNTQISAAIPSQDLRQYLDRALSGEGDTAVTEPVPEEEPVAIDHGIVLFDMGGRRSPPAYVERVRPGSPAEAIGLQADDLILRIDEHPVRSCLEFENRISKHRPGDKILLTFKRKDQVMRRELTLGAKR
ncbi:MAG: S1C family serine protease [Planctomycetota bacterium]|jgi:S1-C subfamily serine protease